jgi:site-specific recombinase XerD
MLGWIVRVALCTGVRAGEIKGLTRRQVNLGNRTVHLTETKNGSSRTVPLTHEAATISGHKSMYTHLRAEDLVSRLDQPGVRWFRPGEINPVRA